MPDPDLQHQLERLDVVVIGPAPSVAAALNLLAMTPLLDGAILDIELQGEPSFPVADALQARGILFVFASGYDPAMIPAPYQGVQWFEKPIDVQEVIRVVLG